MLTLTDLLFRALGFWADRVIAAEERRKAKLAAAERALRDELEAAERRRKEAAQWQ